MSGRVADPLLTSKAADKPASTSIRGGRTRLRILDAGMRLLVEKGFRSFSASAVAERAGLTRMAMLYHFPSVNALLAALVQHVTALRIDGFVAAISDVQAVYSYKGQAYRAAVAAMAWNQLSTPAYTAFAELVSAARTDPVLAAIIQPAIEDFDRSRRVVSGALFPAGSVDAHDFQLARDVVRFLIEGVGHGVTIVDDRDERIARLRHFVEMLVATTPGNDFLEIVSTDWAARRGNAATGATDA